MPDVELMKDTIQHCINLGFTEITEIPHGHKTGDYVLGRLVLRTMPSGHYWCFLNTPGLISSPTPGDIDLLLKIGVQSKRNCD